MIAFLVTGISRARWFHRLGTSFECITWNALNQLTAVTKNAVTVATYSYDGLDRRVDRLAGSSETAWTYDGKDILRQAVGIGGGTTTTAFIHGGGVDEPVALDGGANGTMTFVHADALGSVTRTTTTAGGVADTLTYDAWGNLQSGTPSPHGFTGREWDAATGLWFYRARWYDPKTARFASEDPLGLTPGPNAFEYVRGNPVLLWDPSGLWGTSKTPPDPRENTIVCDGKGGIRTHIAPDQSPWDCPEKVDTWVL